MNIGELFKRPGSPKTGNITAKLGSPRSPSHREQAPLTEEQRKERVVALLQSILTLGNLNPVKAALSEIFEHTKHLTKNPAACEQGDILDALTVIIDSKFSVEICKTLFSKLDDFQHQLENTEDNAFYRYAITSLMSLLQVKIPLEHQSSHLQLNHVMGQQRQEINDFTTQRILSQLQQKIIEKIEYVPAEQKDIRAAFAFKFMHYVTLANRQSNEAAKSLHEIYQNIGILNIPDLKNKVDGYLFVINNLEFWQEFTDNLTQLQVNVLINFMCLYPITEKNDETQIHPALLLLKDFLLSLDRFDNGNIKQVFPYIYRADIYRADETTPLSSYQYLCKNPIETTTIAQIRALSKYINAYPITQENNATELTPQFAFFKDLVTQNPDLDEKQFKVLEILVFNHLPQLNNAEKTNKKIFDILIQLIKEKNIQESSETLTKILSFINKNVAKGNNFLLSMARYIYTYGNYDDQHYASVSKYLEKYPVITLSKNSQIGVNYLNARINLDNTIKQHQSQNEKICDAATDVATCTDKLIKKQDPDAPLSQLTKILDSTSHVIRKPQDLARINDYQKAINPIHDVKYNRAAQLEKAATVFLGIAIAGLIPTFFGPQGLIITACITIPALLMVTALTMRSMRIANSINYTTFGTTTKNIVAPSGFTQTLGDTLKKIKSPHAPADCVINELPEERQLAKCS